MWPPQPTNQNQCLVQIKELSEQQAISRGADVIGEGNVKLPAEDHDMLIVGLAFIFSTAGAIILWEYNRGQEKKAKDEEAKNERRLAKQALVRQALDELDVRMYEVEDKVDRIFNRLEELSTQHAIQRHEVLEIGSKRS